MEGKLMEKTWFNDTVTRRLPSLYFLCHLVFVFCTILQKLQEKSNVEKCFYELALAFRP